MSIKSETQQWLEQICYLLGHIIVADGKIDVQETVLLNDFINANSLGAETKDELLKIFSNNNDKINLDDVILKLCQAPTSIVEQALIAALLIAYGDGGLDEKEEKIIMRLALGAHFDLVKYEKIKTSASSLGKHLFG
jgi:tellurite resistance protein